MVASHIKQRRTADTARADINSPAVARGSSSRDDIRELLRFEDDGGRNPAVESRPAVRPSVRPSGTELAIIRLETDGGLQKECPVPSKPISSGASLKLPPGHAEICRLHDDGCPQASLDV